MSLHLREIAFGKIDEVLVSGCLYEARHYYAEEFEKHSMILSCIYFTLELYYICLLKLYFLSFNLYCIDSFFCYV